MLKITIEDGELVVRPVGINRIRAARDQVRVPLAQIRGVRIPPPTEAPKAIFRHRVGDAEVPRPSAFGPMHHNRGQTLIVELDDHHANELVVQVNDALGAAEMIRRAVSAQQG
ncbi:MAG: hypothetical protein ACPGWS_04165 [Solirubrobacterales bacterium]